MSKTKVKISRVSGGYTIRTGSLSLKLSGTGRPSAAAAAGVPLRGRPDLPKFLPDTRWRSSVGTEAQARATSGSLRKRYSASAARAKSALSLETGFRSRGQCHRLYLISGGREGARTAHEIKVHRTN